MVWSQDTRRGNIDAPLESVIVGSLERPFDLGDEVEILIDGGRCGQLVSFLERCRITCARTLRPTLMLFDAWERAGVNSTSGTCILDDVCVAGWIFVTSVTWRGEIRNKSILTR